MYIPISIPRKVYFCIGWSKFWDWPLHRMISKLKKKFNLPWLRFSMSYHRFPNFCGLLQQDLQSKLMDNIESRDLKGRGCNCSGGNCPIGGNCRKTCIVYQAKCRQTGKVYIGSTMQTFKKRFGQHCQNARELFHSGKHSTCLARHIVNQWDQETCFTPTQVRSSMELGILWSGKMIGCMKSFGRLGCRLCAEEKLAILRAHRDPSVELMNSITDIYEPCRHRARFHKLEYCRPCADDPNG